MKNNLSTLHDIAMEFADEAQFALKKGDKNTAHLFFEKAYILEKEFALAFPLDDEDFQLSRSVFLRSAATLALDCNKYEEAKTLALQALNNKPHPAIIEELNEILEKSKQTEPAQQSLDIIGIVVSADMLNNQIKIQDTTSKEFYILKLSQNMIIELVKLYWAAQVQVKGKLANGIILLEDIRQAA